MQQLTAKLEATQGSVTRLEDVKAIEKLQRAYGYYVDKALWSQIVELFAEDGTVQLGGGGLYKGKEGVARQFSMAFDQGMGRGAGKDGLRKGVLFNHPQLQGIVDVDADGKTAHARWRRPRGRSAPSRSGTKACTRTSTSRRTVSGSSST